MKKLISILLCITMVAACFAACGNKTEKTEADKEKKQTIDTGNEYALYSNDSYYPVSKSFLVGGIFENLKKEHIKADDPYPAQNWYTSQGLLIKANINKPKSAEGEAIWFINAVKEGKTPREVGIGDSEASLLKAYENELFLKQDWIYDASSEEPKFDEVYVYAPPADKTTFYLAFFTSEDKVVMIEIADGFELRPQAAPPQEAEETKETESAKANAKTEKTSGNVTLSKDKISSAEVSQAFIGGQVRHTLSDSELKEFVDSFNGCKFTEKDCAKISENHTAMSDSVNVVLTMSDGKNIYYTAFLDQETMVSNESNITYYSLYNGDLCNYIWGMAKYFDQEEPLIID